MSATSELTREELIEVVERLRRELACERDTNARVARNLRIDVGWLWERVERVYYMAPDCSCPKQRSETGYYGFGGLGGMFK